MFVELTLVGKCIFIIQIKNKHYVSFFKIIQIDFQLNIYIYIYIYNMKRNFNYMYYFIIYIFHENIF